ncbi:MAG: DNA-binding protein [Thermoprotei archaeon]|nr:MAG: DNA-binding protein [Thermoprotei archaeon]
MRLMKVKDVKPGMNDINLVVRVVSVSKPRKVMTRYGEAMVASALVADETGEITLTLWRNQVNIVKPGYMIRIEGAFAKKFRDKLELNVGRRGRITVVK